MRRLLVLGCILGLLPTAAFAAKAVLLVDGQEITDVRLENTKRAIQAQAQGRQIPEDALLRQAVDQVIGQALLVSAAKEAGTVPSDEEIEAAFEAQRKALGGPEALAARLKQAGLTEDDVRKIEFERLAVQRFVKTQIIPSVEINDAELKAYYDSHPDEFKHDAQINVRQVLVAVAPNGTDEQRQAARARAEEALKRLRDGESFEHVAAELSDDPSKARGGEVGWVRKGMLLPQLEPAVFALADGEVSAVLESQHGYHLFRVDAHREAGTYALDEIKPQLEQMLRQREVGVAITKFVVERRKSASVLPLDPALEAVVESSGGGAAPTP